MSHLTYFLVLKFHGVEFSTWAIMSVLKNVSDFRAFQILVSRLGMLGLLLFSTMYMAEITWALELH
jgi:hypothetical protein